MKKSFCLIWSILLICAVVACAPAGLAPNATHPSQPGTSSVSASEPPTASVDAPSPQLPTDSTLTVHFIDVGQADAALLLCDGAAMLIDGGNVDDSSLIAAYLKEQEITRLDYVVATHAHEDHVGGLSGALNVCTADTVYAPVTDYDSKAFRDFAKYVTAQGIEITIPSAGDIFSLGGSTVEILAPQHEYEDTNNTSIVLRVDYGETSFLLTGDAERQSEQDMLDAGCDLSATVLKVGHHGSETSTSYPFLREVMPKYAVISVGEGNSYGHPEDVILSRLRDAEAQVYRTDLQGHIIATSDGKTVSFEVGRNVSVQTNPTLTDGSGQLSTPQDEVMGYIGNANSKKFHLPTCGNLPAEKNQVPLGTWEDAINGGFTPCGNCLGKESCALMMPIAITNVRVLIAFIPQICYNKQTKYRKENPYDCKAWIVLSAA